MKNPEIVAKGLLSIKAVFINPHKPFIWASGIKAPMYCDNRLILSDVGVRKEVEQALADTIREEYPNCGMLMGTATAGISHAAIVAHLLDIPMGYVRGNSKDHGRNRQIEGKFEKGEKIVVIEDLISTAGSCVDVVECLREAGAEVLGIVSIFNYEMEKGTERLKNANIKNTSLVNLDSLLDVAVKEGYIEKEFVSAIKIFRDNPSEERWVAKMQEINNEKLLKLKDLVLANKTDVSDLSSADLCSLFSSGSSARLLGDVFADYIIQNIGKEISAVIGLTDEGRALAALVGMSLYENHSVNVICIFNEDTDISTGTTVVVNYKIDGAEKNAIDNLTPAPKYVISLFGNKAASLQDSVIKLEIIN